MAATKLPPQVVTKNGITIVTLEGVEWALPAVAFGVASIDILADVLDKEVRLSVPKAKFPGTSLGYDLDLHFTKAGDGWSLQVRSQAFALDTSVAFAPFVGGAAQVRQPISAVRLSQMAPAVGWTPKSGRSGFISFGPDLSWALTSTGGFRTAGPAVSVDVVVLRAHGAGLGPFDSLLDGPGGASTSAMGAAPRFARGLKLRCGTTLRDREIVVRPRGVTLTSTAGWADGRKAIGLDGVWRVQIARLGKRGGADFDSLKGLVLIGADASGGIHTFADFGFQDGPAASTVGKVGMLLGPTDGDHGLELRASHGRVTRCAMRADLVQLAVPVEGADFSRLEFTGQDIVMLLDDTEPQPHETDDYVFGAWGEWKIPLRRARLRVARTDDLLSLNFRFRGLHLYAWFSSWTLRGDPANSPALLAEFPGQHVLEEAFLKLFVAPPIMPANPVDSRKTGRGKRGDISVLDKDHDTPPDDPLQAIAEARLADPSRLVFSLPTTGRRHPKVEYPLTLDALTDWMKLSLLVAPRAAFFDVSQTADDWLPKTLRNFGVPEGTDAKGRLHHVVDPIQDGVDEFQTAIEMPARLQLSPDQRARFQTRGFSARREHGRRITPLWSARLQMDQGLAPLRAIGSRDFSGPAFIDQAKNPDPERGAFAPWDDPKAPRQLRLPLSKNDRHQIVALTTLYGLPTLPRIPPTVQTPGEPDQLPPSNFPVPKYWALDGFDEQGIYIPPPMPADELMLTSLGGSLDVQARFEPPAAPYYKSQAANLFPALSVESWNQESVLGRDVSVEVIYKGFLLPIGHRASLVKRTERYFLDFPDAPPKSRSVTAYLIQRYFIRINHPERNFPRVGHPYDARDFPLQSVRILTTRSPDIVDPQTKQGTPDGRGIYDNGQIDLPGGHGIAFWPRTRKVLGAEVQFEVMTDSGPGGFNAPMMFVDNTAVHDPASVRAAVDHYNRLAPDVGLRTASFRGSSQRYAPEKRPGASSFQTARWVLGVRGRVDGDPTSTYKMTGAMEGQDQPPFYPLMSEGHVLLRTLQQFSNRTGDHAVVSFDPDYVRHGLSKESNPATLYLDIHGYLPADQGTWFSSTLEPVRMDMNGNGDRSGGVAKPNTLAVCLSSETGPVGGQTVAARPALVAPPAPPLVVPLGPGAPPPPPAPPPPRPAESARSGLLTGLDFFPEDARLLGLLSFRDLIKTALIGLAPKLVEQAEVAEEEAEAELNKLLEALTPQAKAAVELIKEVTGTLSQKLINVKALYPRLVAAITAVTDAGADLERVLADTASSPLQRLKNAIDVAGKFNDRVGDLLAELDRLVGDPIPPELKAVLDQLGDLVTRLRSLTPTSIGLLARQTVIDGLVDQCKSGSSLWFASAFGPAAYQACTTLDSKQDNAVSAFLAAYASTAAESLCYDAVGKPTLQFLAAVEQAKTDATIALKGDIKVQADGSLKLVGRALDFTQQVALGPLVHGLGSATAVCKVTADTLESVMTGADGLVGDVPVIEGSLGDAQIAIAALAEAEAWATAQVSAGGSALDQAKRAGVRASTIQALELALGRLVAARDVLMRTRQAAGSSFDKLRAMISGLKTETVTLAGYAAAVRDDCNNINKDIGKLSQAVSSASTWATLRNRAFAETSTLFRHLQDALGAALPGVAPTLPPAPLAPAGSPEADAIAAALACKTAASDVAKRLGDQTQPLVKAAFNLATNLSSLRSLAARQLLQTTGNAIAAEFGTSLQPDAQQRLVDRGNAIIADGATLATDIQTFVSAFPATFADIATMRTSLAAALVAAGRVDRYVADYERAMIAALLEPAASLEKAAQDKLTALATNVLKPLVDSLVTLYTDVRDVWDKVRTVVAGPELDQLQPYLQANLKDLLSATGLRVTLVAQLAELAAAQTALVGGGVSGLATALQKLDPWRKRLAALMQGVAPPPGIEPPALVTLANEVGGVFDDLAHGRLADLVDVTGVRTAIEGAILNYVLPKLNLSYAFGTGVNDLPEFFVMLPEGDADKYGGRTSTDDLSISFQLSIDLKNPSDRKMSSRGVLQPFSVNIFGVLTLFFKEAVFTAGDGASPGVDIRVADAKLGDAVSFIEALETFLSPAGGDGFYVDINLAPPSVEAGFAIDLGTISVGEVAFINVSFGASVMLPFDNRPALFKFNLARRKSPFLISVLPFGGGGFVSLISDAKGLVGFEASFEYGAVVGFQFSVLAGQGRVTTGLYIARSGDSAALSGFFVASGSAHVACFGISATLLISISQEGGGDVMGNATFTFSFSLGIAHVDYSVGVHRTIAKGWSSGGGPALRGASANKMMPAIQTSVAPDTATRQFLASLLAPDPPDPGDVPIGVRSLAVAMDEDWMTYRSYFDEAL